MHERLGTRTLRIDVMSLLEWSYVAARVLATAEERSLGTCFWYQH